MLDYDEGVQEDLMKHWKRYKLRMKLKLEDKSDALSLFATMPASVASDSFDYVLPQNELDTFAQLNAAGDTQDDRVIFSDPRGKEFGVRAILSANEPRTRATECSALLCGMSLMID